MPDQAEANESAFVHKYSDEQVEYSRSLTGLEPDGAELAGHHAIPADGIAGDHPDASEEEA